MDVAADLLRRAEHYRELAAHVTDAQTRAGLLELSEKYEAIAQEVRADHSPRAQ
jgi:hypothetical protein